MTTDVGAYDDVQVMFFADARDMLQQIENALLTLENDPHDQDTINALFRVAHTIKGSAGMFGMDRVVRFTHQVESVLGRVRTGELVIDLTLSDVLLKSADVISALLTQVEQRIETPDYLVEMDRNAAVIVEILSHYLDDPQVHIVANATAKDNLDNASEAGTWHISLRFGTDAFRNGFDPLSVIEYLRSVGELVHHLTIVGNLPQFEGLDSQACYLGFEIRLQTAATRAEIEAAFEFIGDDCVVRILPPNRSASDFIGLMRDLPDENQLGDLLVGCGVVTRCALDDALATQQPCAIDSDALEQKSIGKFLVGHERAPTGAGDTALAKSDNTDDFDALFDQSSAARSDRLDVMIAVAPDAQMKAVVAGTHGNVVYMNAAVTAMRAEAQGNGVTDVRDTVLQSVQALAPPASDESNKPMFERLGGIVRLLHDSLRELGYDRSLSHVAAQITDAQARLEYVATLTEQAANKVLNAIDLGMPEQERLATQGAEMDKRWMLLVNGKLSSTAIKALAGDSRQFAAMVAQVTESEKTRLLEIMMAQDFQDITGQLIKKIIAIINTAELELAKLLRDNAPSDLREAIAVDESRSKNLIFGPSLPATALAQDVVDDLLESLGF